MCQENWKLLSLRKKYSLGKDLVKPVFAFQAWWETTEKLGEHGAAGHADLPKLILNGTIWFVLNATVAEHVGNWTNDTSES